MGYDSQNYWILGLCPSSGILETRKHIAYFPVLISVGFDVTDQLLIRFLHSSDTGEKMGMH
jgi:hypothetical protein